MRRPALTIALAVTVPAVLVGLPAAQADRGPDDHGDHAEHGHADRFQADLEPLNADAHGRVRLEEHDGHLEVELRVKDLDGGIHLAHIHGIRQAENECPGMSFDTDHNGLVDLVEGLPAYGPVQLTLSNGLNDTGDRLRYERSYTVLDGGDAISALGDLSQYAIVVHGVDLDGDGLATNPNAGGDAAGDADDNEISMPAVCGTIEAR